MTTRRRSWKATSRTCACNDQTRSPNLNPTQRRFTMPHHAAQDQRPAELEAEIATSLDPDMEIESRDRRVRLREEATDSSRHTQDASTD